MEGMHVTNFKAAVKDSKGIIFESSILDSPCVKQRKTCILCSVLLFQLVVLQPLFNLSFKEILSLTKRKLRSLFPFGEEPLLLLLSSWLIQEHTWSSLGIQTQITHWWVIAFLSLGRSPPKRPSLSGRPSDV